MTVSVAYRYMKTKHAGSALSLDGIRWIDVFGTAPEVLLSKHTRLLILTRPNIHCGMPWAPPAVLLQEDTV